MRRGGDGRNCRRHGLPGLRCRRGRDSIAFRLGWHGLDRPGPRGAPHLLGCVSGFGCVPRPGLHCGCGGWADALDCVRLALLGSLGLTTTRLGGSAPLWPVGLGCGGSAGGGAAPCKGWLFCSFWSWVPGAPSGIEIVMGNTNDWTLRALHVHQHHQTAGSRAREQWILMAVTKRIVARRRILSCVCTVAVAGTRRRLTSRTGWSCCRCRRRHPRLRCRAQSSSAP